MILLANAINWYSFFFLMFALLACGFALFVLFSQNIVRMAFYLILALGATSGLFFLAGAHFVGAMQLMIYVGGTLVLLIFGVMLTAQTGFVSMKTSGSEWILATIVGGSLLMLLMQACWNVPDWAGQPEAAALVQPVDAHATTGIGLSIIGVRPDRLDARKTRLQSGMSGYLLPFEIISVHLLIVLVGAAYLARSKRQVPSRE